MAYKFFFIFLILFVAYTVFSEASAQRLKIAFVNIGEVQADHISIAEEAILDFYHAKVKAHFTSLEIKEEMLSRSWKEDKPQSLMVLNAQAVNLQLADVQSSKYDLVLGITDSALTIGEELISEKMLIRGLAGDTLDVATISTYKLKNESEDAEDFAANLTKVVRHEIGHVLGLPHCSESEQCLMVFGYQFENMIPEFCSFCLDKLDQDYLKK